MPPGSLLDGFRLQVLVQECQFALEGIALVFPLLKAVPFVWIRCV